MLRKLLSCAAFAMLVWACAEAGEGSSEIISKPAPQQIVLEDGESGPDWRKIAPENIAIIKTKYGEIAIELNPEFAPGQVARFKELIAKRAYNGSKFYRVIDGFVAQGGLYPEASDWKPLEIEAEQPIHDTDSFHPLGNSDLFAPEVGFDKSFPAGRDTNTGMKWLLHCPGAVAMARGNNQNSADTEFYITLDSQRYLDRNMSIFGRVIDGMEFAQKLNRTTKDGSKPDEMFSIKLGSEFQEGEIPRYEVAKSNSGTMEGTIRSQRSFTGEFYFNTPPEVVDVCDVNISIKKLD